MASSQGRKEGLAAAQSFRLALDHSAIVKLLTSEEGPIAKDLFKKAIMVERRAKINAPYKTGRLRASIASRMSKDFKGLYAEIGSNVAYAAVQEFNYHPYLRPALDDVMKGRL